MLIFENAIWVLVLIGVMILVHELGHYWAARWFDVRIDVFSIGFGPRLFGIKRGETDFKVSAIIFGGYVKMAGDQPGDENIDDPRAFLAKPRWQRLIIALAGPAMNVVLAVAILTGVYMVRYPKPLSPSEQGVIGYVAPGSAAANAGLRDGDRIVKIGDTGNPTWEQILVKEISSADRPLEVEVVRQGKHISTTVTPKTDPQSGLGVAGWQELGEVQVAGVYPDMPAEKAGLQSGDVLLRANGQQLRSQHRLHEIIEGGKGQPVDLDILRDDHEERVHVQPVYSKLDGPERWVIGVSLEPRMQTVQLSLPAAMRESLRQNAQSATLMYRFLVGIIERRMSAKSLSGPVGIAQISGEAARQGAVAFLGLMALLSLNLAVFNLLPIPILDGGVIMMLLVEMLMRRDLSLRVKEAFLKLGFVFLMAVLVFTVYNDISKLLPPG
jgi:regulator of sigma E protease